MSNITVTLESGQTAVVGIASSREAYEVEVSSGMAGADGVGIAAATIENGILRLTLSNNAIINAGAVTVAGMTGTLTFSGNTIGEFSNGAVNIKGGNSIWSFSTNGGLGFPDATIQTTAFTGNANNAVYLGGVIASQYAYANAIPSVTGYQTIAGLAANVATLSANNSAYLGGIAANQYAYANATISFNSITTGVPRLPANTATNVIGLLAGGGSRIGLTYLDTSTDRVKVWNSGNTAWLTLATTDDVVNATNVNFTSVSSNVIPSADLTYTLGTPTRKWHSLYVGTGPYTSAMLS